MDINASHVRHRRTINIPNWICKRSATAPISILPLFRLYLFRIVCLQSCIRIHVDPLIGGMGDRGQDNADRC